MVTLPHEDRRQPRILVIEAEEHYFLCESSLELLGPRAELTFLIGRGLTRGNRATKDWREMFTSRADGQGVVLARHRTIFLRALLLARRHDLVYVQTGPDFGALTMVLGFAVMALAVGDRTIVSLHEVTAYLRQSRSLTDRLRALALRRVRGVTFESDALREFYRVSELGDRERPRLGVVYVRYALPTQARSERGAPYDEAAKTGMLRVGLVGGVTHKRRDYPMLVAALRLLSAEERAAIVIVALGNCRKQKCRDIMGGIAELVAVDFLEGHLTERQFLERGQRCDLLVAPLIAEFSYGQRKGTGAFGDAIRLARPILVPRGSDPRREFSTFAREFDGSTGLADEFRAALNERPVLADGALEPFMVSTVFTRLNEDLALGL